MGRKRKEPKTVFLRVFDEGKKLTEEQKEWLLSNRKNDSKQSKKERKSNGLTKR